MPCILATLLQVMANVHAEANRMTALREAAINATLNHPHIVTTYLPLRYAAARGHADLWAGLPGLAAEHHTGGPA